LSVKILEEIQEKAMFMVFFLRKQGKLRHGRNPRAKGALALIALVKKEDYGFLAFGNPSTT
jgi:hypothetical protein